MLITVYYIQQLLLLLLLLLLFNILRNFLFPALDSAKDSHGYKAT